MKKENIEKYTVRILFVICILFQLGCMVVINSKTIPGGDEWFSYGLANNASEGSLFINQKWIDQNTGGTGWIQSEDIWSYFVVDEGEEFDFRSVIDNQKRDVHPPLYYILVHIFCSLTPGAFNMLQSGMVNFIALIGIHIILWKMGKFFFQSEFEKLLPSLVLCFSPITELIFGYDRMYALLVFFCLLITYLQLRLKEDTSNRKILIGLAITTCLGGLTHYYFYMYLFAAFVIYVATEVFISKRSIKNLFPCIISHCVGGITAIVLYPTAIRHMLFSYRGEQIRDGLFENKIEGFTAYIRYIDEYCFNGYMLMAFVAFAIAIVIGWYLKKADSFIKNENMYLFLGTIILFYGIIAFISYEKLPYYISPIYIPLVILLCVCGLRAVWFIPNKLKTLVVALLFAFMLGNSLAGGVEDALDTDEYNREITTMLQTQDGKDCVFVYESWNNLFNNRIWDLMHFDEILTVSLEEIQNVSIAEQLDNRRTENELVVYLWDQNNDYLEQQIMHIEEELGKEAKLLFSSRKFSVYSMN